MAVKSLTFRLTQLKKVEPPADGRERAVTIRRNFVGAANLAAFAEVPHLWRLLDDLSHFGRIINFTQTHLGRAAMK